MGVKPGLVRMTGALDVLAEPHRSYPIVHVAGTNGKTSVAWMARAILDAHGLNAGSFVSPHLERLEQRYAVGSSPMEPARFAELVAETVPLVEHYEQRAGERLTYFELTTVLAFALFAAEAVDAAVVEVGLGGRLDATNVVEAAVSVITSIGVDHTEYLGETVGEIAGEKAAILKQGGSLVTGELAEEVTDVVAARVAETEASWAALGRDFRVETAAGAVGGWLADMDGLYESYPEVLLRAHGRHQVDNLALAVASCEALLGRALSHEALLEAAATVTLPGRLEIVSGVPLTLIDGAHNPLGFEALGSALRHEFPTHSWVLVIGAMEDKPLGAMIDSLSGLVDYVIGTAADAERARPAQEVAGLAGESLGVPAEGVPSVAAAVDRARHLAGEDGAVLVTGSLYVVAEARASIGS